jgi:hypothetical protein
MQLMKPRTTLGACKLPTVCLMLVLGVVIGAQAQPQDTKQAKPPRPAPAKSQPAAPTKMVLEPKAMDLLKATSERLAAAKSMSFTAVGASCRSLERPVNVPAFFPYSPVGATDTALTPCR